MNILEKICKDKSNEINILKKKFKPSNKKKKTRSFLKNLINKDSNNYNVIEEIKKKSPRKGIICEKFSPIQIAKDYEKAGAKCISVLTEEKYFGGNINLIKEIKQVVSIPLLRKDFIIDDWQIYESYHSYADCVLLILAILTDTQLKNFYKLSRQLGMDVICEVHNEKELKRALNCKVDCIGINNRNLKTLDINTNTFNILSKKIPDGIIKICESGSSSNKELRKFTKSGADAFLIGETLMKSSNILIETKEMIKK